MQLHHAGHLTLPALWRALALNPARLLGLDAGRLAPGAPADLVLFDPDAPFVLDRATLRSKSKNTPYDLRRMQGRVLRTWVDGVRGVRAGARMTTAVAFALGYLLGSIPFGVLITRALGLGDLRGIGSGNIGATNVLRTGNKAAAAATLVLDAGKGAVAVLLARALFGETAAMVAGFAAFLGHCFPVWLRFRGGKGVATFLGLTIALAWPAGLAACATWLATAFAFRTSSLAALVAAATVPLWLALLGRPDAIWFGIAVAALVFVRHHANIGRLLAGTEPKIGGGR